MRGSDCTCRYWSILYERHRPISLIMLVLTPEQRMALAPALRRDFKEISLGVKPRLGPRKRTAYFSTLLMSTGVVLTQITPLLKVARF